MTYRPTEDAMEALVRFAEDRDWEQFHTPHNLAKSIAVEAGELLECFQWSEDVDPEAVQWEVADILCYAYRMCGHLGIDPAQLVIDKLDMAGEKYPVETERSRSRNRSMGKIQKKNEEEL